MLSRMVLPLGALAALALFGCGSDDPDSEEEQIREAVASLQEAWADGDTERICNELLPADYLTEERGDTRSLDERIQECEEADLGSVPDAETLSELEIERIEIQESTADVYWKDVGYSLDVSKIDGQWRWVIDD